MTSPFVVVSIRLCLRLSDHSSICCSLLAVLLLVILSGCMALPDTTTKVTKSFLMADMGKNPGYTSRINCFLNLKDDQGPAIRLEVAGIEVVSDGFRLPIVKGPLKISSTEIRSGQLFLGSIPVPPGRYHRLSFSISKGEVQKSGGQYAVMTPEPFSLEVSLSADLNLEPGDSSTLLISWDSENSFRPDNTISPALTASPALKQIPLDIILVTCPDINTIFILRADKNWVVDSFGLTGGPTYMAVSPGSNQLLYVLASRERMIKVINLSTYRTINFFPVPLNDDPSFMTISPDGGSAFLLDEQSGYLSRVNLTTGQSDARVLLNYRPKYAAYLNEENLLAVSLSLAQKVLLLDPESLAVRGTITTGGAPDGIFVVDNQILIAEYGDNSVSIAELRGRGAQSRLAVGFGPRRLMGTGRQVFVSNYNDGSLSVLQPGQFGVIQEIYGLGRPLEMVFNQSYLRLYVADEKMAALAVINTNSKRLLGHIFLGAKPFDLKLIE